MYDAIVVGARCAGSPTAMLLARQGFRVLLVDKGEFPSDTISTHYIHQPGVSRLRSWGLLDRVAASNCPPVNQMLLDFGPFSLRGTPPPFDGAADAYCPRRTVLDKILVDAAVEAGAELREHFTVEGLLWDGDRVSGIRGHSRGGKSVEERARIVIGADGQHSLVAKEVDAGVYNAVPVRTCAYYAYWSDVPLQGVELYIRPDQMLIAGPTNDGNTMVINYWPVTEFHAVRTDIEGHFDRALDSVPSLAERARGGQRVEQFRGTADLNNFYRKPFGPGWALVGDAGYHKDPILAQGISDAFRDAELLSTAIGDGFAGHRSLEEALAGYEQQRNETTMAIYGMTCDMATLQPPPPDQQALIGSLIGNQEQINRFFGTATGAYPIPEFFSPENIGRIMSAAEQPLAVST